MLARIEGSQVRCFTRNGNDWSSKMPSLVKDLLSLGLSSAWLDGEIVVPGANGMPDFQALQNAFDGRHTEALQYFVFDLPFFAGYDLRNVPLQERRAVLSALIGESTPPSIRYSEISMRRSTSY